MAILRSFRADMLRVKIMDSRENMGREAAREAADCLRGLLSQKQTVNMIFAAAPSQNETLDFLSAEPGIDWSRVNAFHMDEYIGLPEGAPQAFGSYLRERFFERVPLGCVHYINGGANDWEAECARYAALLSQNPADIVMLGIGENAHIAFNDPGVAKFSDERAVKIVPLDPVCRGQQVNDGCFERLELVPSSAITLTIPALTRAAHMFCTVPAATKARAAALTVLGEISEKVPATVMRCHADARLYLDPDSGRELLEEK